MKQLEALGLGILVLGGALCVSGTTLVSHAQYSTPGGDRTQGTNYTSNQPPAMNQPPTGSRPSGPGNSPNAQGFNNTNGFNPQTGTWGAVQNPFTQQQSSSMSGPSANFNPQNGTWSTSQGSNGSSVNVFTPSQAVSGGSTSGFPNNNINSNSKLYSGPKVISRVAIKPKLTIFTRVPIRPRP